MLRKQADEKRKLEQQRKAEEKAIADRIEKQVAKNKEGTDINQVIRMAAQNVSNNINNIEKKIMASPRAEPRDQLPILGGGGASEKPISKVYQPQSKPVIVQTKPSFLNQQPPQSAR